MARVDFPFGKKKRNDFLAVFQTAAEKFRPVFFVFSLDSEGSICYTRFRDVKMRRWRNGIRASLRC